MDGKSNGVSNNNPNVISCSQCNRANNISNSVCIYCGAPLNINTVTKKEVVTVSNDDNIEKKENIQLVNQQQNLDVVKEEKKSDIIVNQEKEINHIFCPKCGKSNGKNNKYCFHCGENLAQYLNNSVVNQSTNNNYDIEQKKEEKKGLSAPIIILLVIGSIAIAAFVPYGYYIVIISAIISLFNKETRPFGIAILITVGVIIVSVVVLWIILLGMCAALLGA